MGKAPEHLRTLVDRFDPAVFDAAAGKATIRLETKNQAGWDARIEGRRARLVPAGEGQPDALLSADEATWRALIEDVRGGMDAYRKGKLSIRRNLHLGVGLLAATSGNRQKGRLEFKRAQTTKGTFSYLEAGQGQPILLLHGLGGTKASFLPTVSALAGDYRLIAPDHLGFGESDKPIAAPYDAKYFAAAIADLMDELGIKRAHVVGNSMGGRVALELGFAHPERVRKLVLLCPSLAWKRDRRWLPLVKVARPELGLIQLAPRPAVEGIVSRLLPTGMDDWARVGLDEFLRSYCTPRGRAAFYAAARQIYLEEPHGLNGFWTRLKDLDPESLFVWGKRDKIVPIQFARHVENALPDSRHLAIDCGHVPQVERPAETHRAIKSFLAKTPASQRATERAATA
jgi:pimeloyl-ACP methyl ester carboxylesterase